MSAKTVHFQTGHVSPAFGRRTFTPHQHPIFRESALNDPFTGLNGPEFCVLNQQTRV